MPKHNWLPRAMHLRWGSQGVEHVLYGMQSDFRLYQNRVLNTSKSESHSASRSSEERLSVQLRCL